METSAADPGDNRDDDKDDAERRMDEAAHRLDLCLGEAIRILRVTRRWSQDELAARVRLSKKTIGRIEKGQTSMSTPQMFRIATALGVEVGDLVQRATDLQAEGFGG